ncbi:MAG: hypothetical protein LHV68_11730 [Elusimicrobia bacterium]|nr:hypothetical protein [Candidatus Liberimonas magnetica]
MKFDKNHFIEQKFTPNELEKIRKSAKRNMELAGSSSAPEIIFHFSYMALIKIGIYCIAKEGYRVKSRPGHHVKIIEALSQILGSKDILIAGDKMRKDRNIDLYSGDAVIDVKEAEEYYEIVKQFVNTI